jgi:hypothetical protein
MTQSQLFEHPSKNGSAEGNKPSARDRSVAEKPLFFLFVMTQSKLFEYPFVWFRAPSQAGLQRAAAIPNNSACLANRDKERLTKKLALCHGLKSQPLYPRIRTRGQSCPDLVCD